MSDETVRLTYSELATARGITLAAARRMTLRHRWPKQIGNDGLSRVLVPASALVRPDHDSAGTGTGTGEIPGDVRHAGTADGIDALTGAGTVDITAVMRSLGEAVASLGVQLTRERERADFAESRAQESEDRAQAAERRVRDLAEQLAAEQLGRTEDKGRADRAEDRIREAEERADILSEQLTAERQLRAEDKERVDHAEQRANEAEDRAQQADA